MGCDFYRMLIFFYVNTNTVQLTINTEKLNDNVKKRIMINLRLENPLPARNPFEWFNEKTNFDTKFGSF